MKAIPYAAALLSPLLLWPSATAAETLTARFEFEVVYDTTDLPSHQDVLSAPLTLKGSAVFDFQGLSPGNSYGTRQGLVREFQLLPAELGAAFNETNVGFSISLQRGVGIASYVVFGVLDGESIETPSIGGPGSGDFDFQFYKNNTLSPDNAIILAPDSLTADGFGSRLLYTSALLPGDPISGTISYASLTLVPEPGAGLLAGIGVAAMALRRRGHTRPRRSARSSNPNTELCSRSVPSSPFATKPRKYAAGARTGLSGRSAA